MSSRDRPKASSAWRMGEFNTCKIERLEDGKVKVTIHKRGWSRAYSFIAVNFGRNDEKIIVDEEIEEEGVIESRLKRQS